MGSVGPSQGIMEEEDMFATEKDHRSPLVPIGAFATAGVLVAGLYSFKQGKSYRSQMLMRARVLMQGATVAIMLEARVKDNGFWSQLTCPVHSREFSRGPTDERFFQGSEEPRAAVSGGRKEQNEPWTGAKVPLNPWQRVAIAAGSAVGALMNPARADLVAALGETTGSPAFRQILTQMRRNEVGQKILKDRPRVTSTSIASAWDSPPGSFGAAYAKFMGDRKFSPDDRPPVRFLDSEDLAYVATRSREVHDFWHVLFNLPTSVMGELALKMVEFYQTGIPMCFFSVAGASWTLKPQQRSHLFTHYAPWALKAGKSASNLMCIYYEEHLNEDLNELRKKWGIIPAPPLLKKQSV